MNKTKKHKVPTYSQFLDTKNSSWKNRSCGITALKSILEYELGKSPSIDDLIKIGLENNAYIKGIGWKHKELAEIANNFGLKGKNLEWRNLKPKEAFKKILKFFPKNPIMASVFKNFNPKNNGHFIVLTGFENNKIYYNETASKKREEIKKEIPLEKFLKGWRKMIVVITKK
jgi:ABC-type bacteriocin/lantibiotic exporter with double-glycine peptidase domain